MGIIFLKLFSFWGSRMNFEQTNQRNGAFHKLCHVSRGMAWRNL